MYRERPQRLLGKTEAFLRSLLHIQSVQIQGAQLARSIRISSSVSCSRSRAAIWAAGDNTL
jgi:hypothetical protein